MNGRRVKTVVRRHVYVLKRSPHRFFDVTVWPLLDVLLFGSLGAYVASQDGSNKAGAPYLLAVTKTGDDGRYHIEMPVPYRGRIYATVQFHRPTPATLCGPEISTPSIWLVMAFPVTAGARCGTPIRWAWTRC